jgi:hypothetical protein
MNTPSTKFGPWHGIARETIPWFVCARLVHDLQKVAEGKLNLPLVARA